MNMTGLFEVYVSGYGLITFSDFFKRGDWIGSGLTGLSIASSLAHVYESNKHIDSITKRRKRFFKFLGIGSIMALSGYGVFLKINTDFYFTLLLQIFSNGLLCSIMVPNFKHLNIFRLFCKGVIYIMVGKMMRY